MNPFDPIDQLIAYVEGQLPPDQREQLEQKLKADPSLRQRLELLQRMDDSVAHTFAPPRFVKVDFTTAQVQAAGAPAWQRWLKLAGGAIAASVALVALLFYYQNNPESPALTPLTASALYNQQVANGFNPEWVCKDDAEFIDTTQKHFGLPLLAQSDSTVQIVGWMAYGNSLGDLGLSPGAKAILAKVNGTPVIVMLDKASAGKPPKSDNPDKLHLFQREVGGVSVYELTPLNEPVASARFHVVK